MVDFEYVPKNPISGAPDPSVIMRHQMSGRPIRSPKKKFLVNWPTHISLNPFQITHDTTQIRKKNNQIKFTYYFILCNLKGVQIFLSTEFDSNFTFIINFTQYE